jgi:hypothetical protein
MSTEVRIFKLTTGEEIIARAEQEQDKIILNKPMTFQAVPTQVQGAMGMAMVPWIISAKGDFIEISLSHIVVETEPKPDLEKKYLSQISGITL